MMMKIHTPEQWYSIFGKCPTLLVDDQGRIWAADQYFHPLSSEPSGLIDCKNNKIYGPDYSRADAAPIAWMETRNDETRIYAFREGGSGAPMLYIIGNRIYTPDQYLTSGMGGDSVGYVEAEHRTEKKSGQTESASRTGEGSAAMSGLAGLGGMENLGCFGMIVLFLLVGKGLDFLPGLPVIVWIGLAAAVVVIRALIIQKSRKGSRLARLMSSMGAGGWIVTVFCFIIGFSALSGLSMPAGFWGQVLKKLAVPALLVLAGLVYYHLKYGRYRSEKKNKDRDQKHQP